MNFHILKSSFLSEAQNFILRFGLLGAVLLIIKDNRKIDKTKRNIENIAWRFEIYVLLKGIGKCSS